jgi:hypothetical protein
MNHTAGVPPDLEALNPAELKALIVSQHELIVSRDSEIEQLKLLIAKLRRMQFGRSSEKLDRQIEQLELQLEALQVNDAEIVAALIAYGEITLGEQYPMGCIAIASDEHNTLAMLKCREGEPLAQLLIRLD